MRTDETERVVALVNAAMMVSGIAETCEGLGLAGFMIWKCGQCDNWHAGAFPKGGSPQDPLYFGDNLDPAKATLEVLVQLKSAWEMEEERREEEGKPFPQKGKLQTPGGHGGNPTRN